VLYDLALSFYSMGQLAEAEEAMKSALQRGIGFSHAEAAERFLIIVVAASNAMEAYRTAPRAQEILKTESRYVPALMISAIVDEQQGKTNAAKQTYEKILSCYPHFTPATKQLAILYAEYLGDDQSAFDLAMKARDQLPADADLAKTLGKIAYRRGDYAYAVQLLKESSRKRTDDADVFYHLGLAYYRLKAREESKEALHRALALNANDKSAGAAKKALGELQ